MPSHFDLIAIGDTTLDVFLQLEDAKIQCDHGKENCFLCVRYPEKVPVKAVTKVPAVGNAANVAVGASRLGLSTALYTILGEDVTGKESFDQLTKEKVAKDYIVWDKKRGTNYSAVLSFQSDRTILVFHEPRSYKLPKLAKASWVYLTAMGQNDAKFQQSVLDYVVKSGAKLAFNPGDLQLREGLEALKPIIKHCEILFLNKDEAERLLGRHEDVKASLKAFHELGARVVVITDGMRGSYCYDGTDCYAMGTLGWPPVEPTGCGDSYAVSLLTALHFGFDIPTAMQWGAANSASVSQGIGAQKGLLTKSKLLTVIKKNPQLQVKSI